MQFYKCKLNVNENLFHDDFHNIIMTTIPNALKGTKKIQEVRKIRTRRLVLKNQMAHVKVIDSNTIIGLYRELRPEDIQECDENGNKVAIHIDNKLHQEYKFIYYIQEEELWIEKTGVKDIETVAKDIGGYISFLDQRIGELVIYPIPDTESFKKGLKKVQGVTEIEVTFIAPNPRKVDFFEKVQEKIGLENLHSGTTIYKTHEMWSGEAIKKDKYVKEALENSEKGYGTVTLKRKGKEVLTTKKRTVTKTLEELCSQRVEILNRINEYWRE